MGPIPLLTSPLKGEELRYERDGFPPLQHAAQAPALRGGGKACLPVGRDGGGQASRKNGDNFSQ
jgi:hypothetical protein